MEVNDVDVIPWGGLSADERARWIVLRATQIEFATPFFSLAFFDAVQASRGDVWVAVLRSENRIAGFLPFHRIDQVAWAAGRYFNDAHNVVAHPQTRFDWPKLLRACDVKAFDFHALVGSDANMCRSSIQGVTESFRADIGTDPVAFLTQLEKGHSTIRKQEQKSRKLAREVGPVRVEVDCRDTEVLRKMISLKRDQYQRTHILDLFASPWTRDLIMHLHRRDPCSTAEGSMRGLLSVLRAGDDVVAAHFGMIENGLLHYWFPTYDTRFARFSPGTALFKQIIRFAGDQGIRCIDMGYGEQAYKRKQTDTISKVVHGCVTDSIMYRNMRSMKLAAAQLAKQMPMKGSLKKLLRRFLPDAGMSKIK